MPLTTKHYAAILLTPLAVSLTWLATRPAPSAPLVAPALPCAAPALIEAPIADIAPIPAIAPIADIAPVAPIAPIPAITPATYDPGHAALLRDRHLVLATVPDLTWSKGQPKLHALGDGLTVDRRIDKTVVPAALQAHAGARFTVFAADGSTCLADAGPLAIHGQVTGIYSFTESHPTHDELAAAAAELGPEDHVLEAALPRSCTGVWARRADLPAPIVFARAADDPALRPQIRRTLDAHPSIVALKAARAAYFADMAPDTLDRDDPWDAYLDRTLALATWTEIGGTRSFATAQVGADDGCGGFNDRAVLLFTLESGTATVHPDPGFLDPLAVMDLDRDGHLEAVVDHGQTLETRGPAPQLATHYKFADRGCGC